MLVEQIRCRPARQPQVCDCRRRKPSSEPGELHRTALPECLLFNEYGPTEATVWCPVWQAPSAGACAIARADRRGSAPRDTCVLNAWMSTQPEGVPGELFAGGAGAARGYSGAPALTASLFVPDPYGNGGRHSARGNSAMMSQTTWLHWSTAAQSFSARCSSF